MSSPNHQTQLDKAVSSLDDLIVTYDMGELLSEAKAEFEGVLSSRELLGQQAIGSFFNLDLQEDERN